MSRVFHKDRIELYKKLPSGSWDSTAILLGQTFNVRCDLGIGNIKDVFSFDINSANDRLTRQFFDGDNSTTAFTLNYAPPTDFLGTSRFKVYVGGFLVENTTDYSVSGTTLTFVSAPATGNRNIRVEFDVISPDDKIAIYFWQGSEAWGDLTSQEQTDAFVMEATITDPRIKSDSGGRIMTIKGTGIIESIFNTLAFVRQVNKKKWYEIVQQMISQINQLLPAGKKIYGQDSSEWAALGNPTTKNDGSAFPDRFFSTSYKRGIEILEEITQDKYTEDGDYIYYVKRDSSGNYGLYVRYKDPDVSATDTLVQQGTTVQETMAARNTDEVVNAVIYNCGFDPYERGMEFLNYNPMSRTALGSKWKYVTTTSQLGQTILNLEFEEDKTLWEITSEGTRKENFPKDASYPYSFTFESRDDAGNLSGAAQTAADDDAFADAVRNECKWRGKEETDRIIRLYSNPRYEVQHVVWNSSYVYSIGNAFNLTVPSFGIQNEYPMRLIDKTVTLWDETLNFKEDETTAAVGTDA